MATFASQLEAVAVFTRGTVPVHATPITLDSSAVRLAATYTDALRQASAD